MGGGTLSGISWTNDEALSKVRLRHAALGAIYQHLKTYLDCMSLGYYGESSEAESELCDKLRMDLKVILEVLGAYYAEEVSLMDG